MWKYERMQRDLDARIEADPEDVAALVYRGNARSFQMLGAADAERDYRAALARAGESGIGADEIRANLDRLLSEGRP